MNRFSGGLGAVLLTFRLREKLRRFQNESRTLPFDESDEKKAALLAELFWLQIHFYGQKNN